MTDCPLSPRKELALTLPASLESWQTLYRAVRAIESEARVTHRKPEINLAHIAELAAKALGGIEAPKEREKA